MRGIPVLLAAMLWTLMLAVACQQERNEVPSIPELAGPGVGRPGETLSFRAMSEDPEGQEVGYKFAWGDTSPIEWSPFYASEQPVWRAHVYADTGSYLVQVKARDVEEIESEWSEPRRVDIGLFPPEIPERPSGPVLCTTLVMHAFTTKTTHPHGEDVSFQFDWNGTVGEWSETVASGSTYTELHAFDSAGTCLVAVRARDEHGGISDWSEGLEVPVVDIVGGPPDSLTLQLETDSTLRLSWIPPVEGVPNSYLLLFRKVGSETFETVIDTSATSVVHDPVGETGDYRVAARFGARVYEDSGTVTTIPVHTDTKSVEELNGSGLAGWGWIRSSGFGQLFSMADTASIPYVDWYVTDFDSGTAGPLYWLASPDQGPTDPGGGVPPGDWHLTELAGPLADEKLPLPVSGDSVYGSRVQIEGTPSCYAVVTADGYYAMVKVTNVRPNQSDIRAQAWFQPIQGLRLLRH